MTDAPGKRAPATIKEQAELIDWIATYCERDGEPLEETWVVIRKCEAEDLRALARRLQRMAPFEDQIRELVTGRG